MSDTAVSSTPPWSSASFRSLSSKRDTAMNLDKQQSAYYPEQACSMRTLEIRDSLGGRVGAHFLHRFKMIGEADHLYLALA